MNSALLSPCQQYRYTLWRYFSPTQGKMVVFIGLNPSTADATQDDPTIRRCIGFAKLWGYDSLCMVNLFAYRATDPKDMQRAKDPIGVENDHYLKQMIDKADLVVAAWGGNGEFLARDEKVKLLFDKMVYCLGRTKHGHPRHPLYVPKDRELEPF